MPTISIDMFDNAPKVGDKVKVTGKVKSIDEETGEVEVSYDDASVIKKGKKRDRDSDDDDSDDDTNFRNMDEEMLPEIQTYDQALSRAFPNTQ